jgi:lytic murein transglycosylase
LAIWGAQVRYRVSAASLSEPGNRCGAAASYSRRNGRIIQERGFIAGSEEQNMRPMTVRLACAALWLVAAVAPAMTQSTTPCGGDFGAWLEGVKKEAAAQSISDRTIQAALAGVTYDPTIIARDHAQGVFHQSFEQFSGRMVPPRLARGQKLLKQYALVFARIEQQYGVPGPVIVAIWGLETDFGANSGKFPTIRSLATLAYDCRRPDKFRGEVLAALRIVERGDMSPTDMRGAWAGEIGQTQFLPSSYLKYAVDYDGNGRRDLIHSVPDVLASTANYLKGYGWARGQPWGEGTANFQVLLQWNASQVYTKTVAYFAQELAATE